MSEYCTVKAFLKALIAVRDQPHVFLKGFDKLTEDEKYLLGAVTADIANCLGEDDFQELLKKFKLT